MVAGISTVRPHESVNVRVAAAEADAFAALADALAALAEALVALADVLAAALEALADVDAALLLDELVHAARAKAATHKTTASETTPSTRAFDCFFDETITPS